MYKRTCLPACCFPSTTLLVDDDTSFLQNLALGLNRELICKFSNSGREAYHFLQKQKAFSPRDYVQQISQTNQAAITTLQFDISSIHQELYNPSRFNEISVVVVDYMMPDMNGLELCKQLKNHPSKKILLTGIANDQLIIEAFNEGIIDCFLAKQNENIIEQLESNIRKLQFKYFLDMSDSMVSLLFLQSAGALSDPTFYDYFTTLCKKFEIAEYYLTETSGSFLLVNQEGSLHYLVVKTTEDLAQYHVLAKNKEIFDEKTLANLAEGKIIPCFWQDDHLLEPFDTWAWSSCFYPAEKVEGKQTYYCALVEKPIIPPIQQQRILSLNNYLNQLSATTMFSHVKEDGIFLKT